MYNYVVVGSGIAGLFTAYLASRHGRVALLTKGELAESNTRYAQGGIAAAVDPTDSPASHREDTLVAGAGLCEPGVVDLLTREAPARIADLIRLGVEFDREDGRLVYGREGAHSRARILHAGGDATGARIECALCRAVRAVGVDVREHTFVTDLLVEDGRARGVRLLDPSGREDTLTARTIVLASGGSGQLFERTTNPAIATGDGLALAYRAGAALANLEFYQFHPTALALPGAQPFLISEAVRGEGGILRDADGRAFMRDYDERGELASRDVVSRAIVRELDRSGRECVFLDVTHLPAERIRRRFPTIVRFCAERGLDVTREPIPVAPVAHYQMGGVLTDEWGETTVPGLFACGEVAENGVHGANRLASNSLLDGVVFAARIVQRTLGEDAAAIASALLPPVEVVGPDASALAPNGAGALPSPGSGGAGAQRSVLSDAAAAQRPTSSNGTGAQRPSSSGSAGACPPPTSGRGGLSAAALPGRADLQRLIWRHLGMVRSAAGLAEARRTLDVWAAALPTPADRAGHELANMLLVGRLMVEAAALRMESRGAHFRSDCPEPDPGWRRRIVLRAAARVGARADLTSGQCRQGRQSVGSPARQSLP